ncbi:Starch-binding associating with outer membrane [Sesbania bispinosa]|nr:Starch-binding associating with outer membrane [Sesbania bispinosa]
MEVAYGGVSCGDWFEGNTEGKWSRPRWLTMVRAGRLRFFSHGYDDLHGGGSSCMKMVT